jgi:hypothetical protein
MNKADYTLKLIEMLVKTLLDKDSLTEDQYIAKLLDISDAAHSLRN